MTTSTDGQFVADLIGHTAATGRWPWLAHRHAQPFPSGGLRTYSATGLHGAGHRNS